MNSNNFKSLKLLLKERFLKLNYGDFYPEVDSAKVLELVADCVYWNKFEPEDQFPGCYFIESSLKNQPTSSKKICIKISSDQIILAAVTDIYTFDPRAAENEVLHNKDFGLDHELLYNALLDLIQNDLDY